MATKDKKYYKKCITADTVFLRFAYRESVLLGEFSSSTIPFPPRLLPPRHSGSDAVPGGRSLASAFSELLQELSNNIRFSLFFFITCPLRVSLCDLTCLEPTSKQI